MQINYNSALNQNPYLNANQALNKIATGIELNKSSDNAASLAIANNLLSQSNGYSQAIENTNSAIAATQIASSATNEQSKILDNIKEKLLQASSDTTSQEGRDNILKDIKSQLEQFDKIASNTNYNGQTLLQKSSSDNSASELQQYQSGLKGENIIEISSITSNSSGYGLSGLVNQDASTFTSQTARDFLDTVDKSIDSLSSVRGEIGAAQNQLESSGRNLMTQRTNTLNAASMFDTDYAKESSNFSKENLLAKMGAFGQAQASYINQQIVSRLLV
ncbi:flagellin [Arcobacter vandammei]|uniref:flagellin N-terminal helical domain-containing protein n=1 Tax=Arcobacter vandammei TaxID=2782243 RepID=UPI0018DF6B2B|nr:flagellin [Arcobacter vandammei]